MVFLGYEDIDEFKTYNNDVADLFVNKLGYVYKFQNFSWIDYILYSGAPSKNAIVKKKKCKEVEVGVSVQEIYPFGPTESYQSLYSITFHMQHANSASSPLLQNDDLAILSELKNSASPSFEMPQIPLGPQASAVSCENGVRFSAPDFKEPVSFKKESKPSLGNISSMHELTKAKDALGLDVSEILPLLEEYLDHLEMVSYALEEAIEHNDIATKNELVEQIIGTAEVFQMDELTLILKGLLENEKGLKEYFLHLQNFITRLKHNLTNNH